MSLPSNWTPVGRAAPGALPDCNPCVRERRCALRPGSPIPADGLDTHARSHRFRSRRGPAFVFCPSPDPLPNWRTLPVQPASLHRTARGHRSVSRPQWNPVISPLQWRFASRSSLNKCLVQTRSGHRFRNPSQNPFPLRSLPIQPRGPPSIGGPLEDISTP